MREEKSMLQLYAGNLWGVVLWLAIITTVVSVLLGVASTATFSQSVTIGGLAAAGIFLGLIAPIVMAGAERKLREVESNYDGVGKELRNTEDKLRDARNFIKEFVSLRDVLEHMKVLRDDYRKRLTNAQIIVRELAHTQKNSADELTQAMKAIAIARDEVAGGAQTLLKARNMAVEHGFEPRPYEEYLGFLKTGDEVAGQPSGRHNVVT